MHDGWINILLIIISVTLAPFFVFVGFGIGLECIQVVLLAFIYGHLVFDSKKGNNDKE